MAVFPGDDVDVDGGLQDLADAKFIVRYEVKAARYIEIINFIKHQHPHVKESASTIPAPCKPRTSTRLKRPLTDSPIPITESKTESNEEEEAPPPKPKVRKKVLTEIDPNFKAPKKEIEQATTECPTVDLDHETKNFIDHYLGNGESGKDWIAKWRKWIRNQHKWNLERIAKKGSSANNYDPKQDMLSPEFEMPAVRSTFTDDAEYFFTHFDPENYDQFKINWLERPSSRGHADEIEEYEQSFKFRKRLGEAEQNGNRASVNAGGSPKHSEENVLLSVS